MRFRSSAVTGAGPRPGNDDAYLAGNGNLLAVADGVTGRPAGGLAAWTATRVVRSVVDPLTERPCDLLRAAAHRVHREVLGLGRTDPSRAGTACTLDAVLLGRADRLTGVHVGDSRVYLCPRDRDAEQLTEDDALDGVLLQSMGGETRTLRPHVWQCRVRPGDRVVLATDGLWNATSDAVALGLVRSVAQLRRAAAARLLVRAAHAMGGRDDVTVVVADVHRGPIVP